MADWAVPLGTTVVDKNSNYSGVQPGDRLLLAPGTRGRIEFRNFHGTAGSYITAVNNGGTVTISASASRNVQVLNCSYFRFSGGGVSGTTYGIRIGNNTNSGVWSKDESNHLEFDRLEIYNGYGGFRLGPKSDFAGAGFVMDGLAIHHCYIHGMDSEAMYVGSGTFQDGLPMRNVEIHHCICEDCGYDGIQLRYANAGTNSIHDNECRDCGDRTPGTTQGGAGIILGDLTDCDCYNNQIFHTDRGIQMLDHGPCNVYRNLVVNFGYARNNDNGCGILAFTEATGTLVFNNTCVGNDAYGSYGIKMKEGDSGCEIYSNLIANTNDGYIRSSGNVHDNCTYATVAAARFVDPASEDYTLRADSPARGGGEDGVDCGAFQYGETPPPDPPDPPPPGPTDPPVPPVVTRFLEPAFPNAQGAAAFTQAGRGTDIYRVTTLSDTPLGNTLRHACEASGPRIVIFEVSGYIELQTELRITNPYIAIFGQTAPGSGVSINYEQFVISTHDVAVRYLRFNPGPSGTTPTATSALVIEYEEDATGDVDMLPYNIFFDHCTFRWGPNGNVRLRNLNWDDSVAENNVSVGYIQRVTFQWCFIYEAFDSVGTLTEASVGMEIGGGCDQITLAYCLFANCREGLQIRGGQVEVVNCIFFNCHVATRMGAARAYAGLEPCKINYWRNQQIHGNNSQQNHMVIVGDGSLTCTNPAGELPHEIYVSTNAGRYKVPGVPAAQWDIMGCLEGGPSNDASDIWRVLMPHTMWGKFVVTDTLANGYTRILRHGGCKMTSTYGRDKADRRIVQAVKSHGGQLPASTMAEVHGWPALEYITPALDTDGDGVPNWFENANGSNPLVADSDQYDYDGGTHEQSYMNIEVYENVHGRDPHVVTWVQVN